jgi:phage-related protein
MSNYQVRVERICVLKEEVWVKVVAENKHEARSIAETEVSENPDSFDFSKEWIEDTDYVAGDVEEA